MTDTKRVFQTELLKIEKKYTENPKEFRKCFTKLGPKTNNGIPMKVQVGDNLVTEKHVLDTWKSELESFYNRPEEVTQKFDRGFFENVMFHKAQLQLEKAEGRDVLLNEFLDES